MLFGVVKTTGLNNQGGAQAQSDMMSPHHISMQGAKEKRNEQLKEEYVDYIAAVQRTALKPEARHYQIKLIEFMVLSYQNKFKK